MKVIKSHKIELITNNMEKTYFKKACGCARKAWNWCLNRWEELSKEGKKVNGLSLKKEFNSLKKEQFPYTYEVTKYATQQPFIRLQNAMNDFFKKHKKNKNKKKRKDGKHKYYPKFKTKHYSEDKFYIGGDQVTVESKKIKIPLLGYVRMREELRYKGKIQNVSITRSADKWYASIAVQIDLNLPKTCENQTGVGIDLGIKTFATLSDGKYILSPKPLKNQLTKIQKLSRKLSKKQHARTKGDTTPKSNNYLKALLKLQKAHRKIAHIRLDFLHKTTSYLVENYTHIAIEDLNIQGMMSNGKLARAISDIGMYEFKRQLQYKCTEKNKTLIIADRWYASSKTCPICKNKKKDLLLKDRVYKCTECGLKIDRDLSASINLYNEYIGAVRSELTPMEIMALGQGELVQLDLTSSMK